VIDQAVQSAPDPMQSGGDQELVLRTLTRRELQVVELLVAEPFIVNHAIASRFGISQRTVELHISKLLKKLGVSNRHEAADVYLALRQQSTAG
jgi:DNA-binding NarL/FixJ family response regulator